MLSGERLDQGARGGLPDALAGASAAIHLSDEQGSTFQPDLEFRGFDASPILGAAGGEGLAVYQNGVRQNEAFGDLVNFDLAPAFAVDKATLVGSDPVFGLNAIGGALSLTMKDGFSAPGGVLDLEGGSFGRASGTLQYAASRGGFGAYLGAGETADQGYRAHSPSRLRQLYADLGWRGDRASLHLTLQGADNALSAVGATPVQMLAADRRAAFTFPQTVRDQLAAVTLTGADQASPTLALAADVYYRGFRQHTLDGNTTNVTDRGCVNPADNPAGRFLLCLGTPADTLYDRTGRPIPDVLGPAIAAGADVTYGEIDRTSTATDGLGAAAQATSSASLLGRANHLVVGVALDHGRHPLRDHQRVGRAGRPPAGHRRRLRHRPARQPQAAAQALAAGEIVAPVDLVATRTDLGLYASERLGPDAAPNRDPERPVQNWGFGRSRRPDRDQPRRRPPLWPVQPRRGGRLQGRALAYRLRLATPNPTATRRRPSWPAPTRDGRACWPAGSSTRT